MNTAGSSDVRTNLPFLDALANTAQRRIWLLETLHQVNAAITNSDDIESEFQQIVDEINLRFAFTSVAIGVVENGWIIYKGVTVDLNEEGNRHPISVGVCGRVARTGVAELIADVSQDPDYLNVSNLVTRELVVPIVVNGTVYGVLNIEASDDIPLGVEEFDVMKTLAMWLGLAVERSRQRQSEQRRLQNLAALQRITGTIAGRVKVERDFHDILADINTEFDFHGTTLGLLKDDHLYFYTSYSNIIPGAEPMAMLPITSGISGRVARTGDPAFIPDVSKDPDFVRFRDDLTQEMCVPVRVGSEVVGVLNIEMDDRRKIDEGDFDVVQTIADHLGLAIANQRRIAELERRNDQLRTVERIVAIIASRIIVEDVFPEVLAELERGFGFGSSGIGVIHEDRLYFRAIEGDPEHPRAAEIYAERGVSLGTGITGTVAITGEPLLITNVQDYPDYLPTSPNVQYEICVPIKIEGRTVGVLNVETPASRPLDTDDLEILTVIANHIGIAMHKSDLYEAERSSRRAVEAIQRVSNIVASTLNTNESLRLIVDTLSETFGYAHVSIRLLESGLLVLSAHSSGWTAERASFALGQGVIGRVAATGVAEFIPDVSKEPAYIASRPGITSEVCVPIVYNGELAGILNIEGDTRRPVTQHDLELMQTFAQHAGTLIHNARTYEQMEVLASRDPITGLPNHREFRTRLKEEIARAARRERSLSLMVIDLNLFKQINDRYGHLAGDDVLRAVGERLSSGLRESDILARYAGDEFVVLLPETDRDVAHRVAKRLESLVRSRPFTVGGEASAPVSLSVGIATYPTDATTALELIKVADDAMYSAKRSRRLTGELQPPP